MEENLLRVFLTSEEIEIIEEIVHYGGKSNLLDWSRKRLFFLVASITFLYRIDDVEGVSLVRHSSIL